MILPIKKKKEIFSDFHNAFLQHTKVFLMQLIAEHNHFLPTIVSEISIFNGGFVLEKTRENLLE